MTIEQYRQNVGKQCDVYEAGLACAFNVYIYRFGSVITAVILLYESHQDFIVYDE
jgi:hypothetical protein